MWPPNGERIEAGMLVAESAGRWAVVLSPSRMSCPYALSSGICITSAVLDTVITHLDEMARAIVTAMQIAKFGRAVAFPSPWRASNVACARGQRPEDGIEIPGHLRLA